MTAITYNVPMTLIREDNNSDSTKISLIVKDCGGFGSTGEECAGYNFNRCPNDDAYCQPFISGDLIYGQIRYDSRNYELGTAQWINSVTGANFYTAAAVTNQTGRDDLNNNYLNYKIDTSNAVFDSVTCWYIKIQLTYIGSGSGADTFITSEPYCPVRCEIPTLLIQGFYPSGYDCNGNFYGGVFNLSGAKVASFFQPILRIYGVLESDGYDFEKTDVNSRTVKSKQTERFLLLSKKLPYYVVQQIAACGNSQKLTIDGVQYTGLSKISKNFDEGSMWILRENVVLVCDEINFTCT